MKIADEAEALAKSFGLNRTASAAAAVREEMSTAHRILNANLSDVQEASTKLRQNINLSDVQEVGSKLRSNLEEVSSKLQQTLGVGGSSAASICSAVAVPFVHGPVLQPEIRRMQMALDYAPEQAVLHQALETLKQVDTEMDLVLTSADGPLQALADESAAAASTSAVAGVAALLALETSNDSARPEEEREAMAQAIAGREEFLRTVGEEHGEEVMAELTRRLMPANGGFG